MQFLSRNYANGDKWAIKKSDAFDRVEYGTPVGRELEKLLKIPINNFNNILTVLQLTDFDPLLELFDFDGRKAMAVYIANDVLEMQTLIPTEDQVNTLRN